MATKCLRTLLISYVDYTIPEWEQMAANNNNFASLEDKANVEKGLVMVGMFGLKDPPPHHRYTVDRKSGDR